MNLKAKIIAAALAFSASTAAAQDYFPAATPPDLPSKMAIQKLQMFSSVKAEVSDTSPADDSFTCASPPALATLATKITNTSMSASTAFTLGLPVGGLEGSANARVFVQDWTRSKPCTAKDGKTQLIYGQGIRIVSTISDIDASAKLSLAAIAAQATLNNKSSSVQAIVIGIPDAAVQAEAVTLLGELTVENFAIKSKIAESLAAKAVAATTGTSEFIGIYPSGPNLGAQVASVFAIQQIADKKTCLDTKGKLATVDAAKLAAVDSVYVNLTKACDATVPSEVQKALAKEALMGFKLKQ
jgi:hypothetical protein